MGNIKNPTIALDFVRFRIRIHATTIEALDFPKFVVLIINPDDMTLGIMGTDKNEPGAHRLYYAPRGDKSVELYSRLLLLELERVCNEIKQGKRYRFEGKKIQNKNIVMFDILNYTEIISRSKPDEK